jgi:kynurenine formamidase
MPKRHVFNHEFVTHHAVFNRNVPFVEDLRDIGLWGSDRPYLWAIPLRTTCIDGAMMRTIMVDW